jgi:putative addiction module component (TIGR02574 family)
MSTSLERIEEQALQLSAEDRAKLAYSLLESLRTSQAEIDASWRAEIVRRVAALDRGEMPLYPAEEVFAEIRRLKR